MRHNISCHITQTQKAPRDQNDVTINHDHLDTYTHILTHTHTHVHTYTHTHVHTYTHTHTLTLTHTLPLPEKTNERRTV